MNLTNTTSLVALSIPQVDRDREERAVVMARAAYHLRPGSGGVPELVEEQPFFTLVDEPYGDPRTSSLRRATEIAYAKPRTDVYFVDPRATPPGMRAAETWPVAVAIGDLRTELYVSGPRAWYRTHFGRWALRPAEPCLGVDVRYEEAFGGPSFAENPVGKGWAPPERDRPRDEEIPAPSVFDPRDPPTEPGKPCRVVGLTPLGPSWQPRLAKAGTYHATWVEDDWPNLPRDFDEAFFNCAPAALQYPGYLRGGEPVAILGLSADGPLAFHLPDLPALVLNAYCMDGAAPELHLQPDTVVLDVNRRTVDVTWRTSFVPRARVFLAQLRLLPGG